MEYSDIFEPFERLVEIEVLGRKCSVPENNSILRGFQYLDMEAISEGEFCWNGECLNCQVWIKNGDKEKPAMSCRTNVAEEMQIVKLSDDIHLHLAETK
ncbi:MAG: 2Fe-2S iron-sulfur cluster-binding protein [Acidobacteriota bacterium]